MKIKVKKIRSSEMTRRIIDLDTALERLDALLYRKKISIQFYFEKVETFSSQQFSKYFWPTRFQIFWIFLVGEKYFENFSDGFFSTFSK